MSYYLHIVAMSGPPTVAGTDENNRAVVYANFEACGRSPVDRIEEEVVSYLIGLGHVTARGVDAWIGPKPTLPAPSSTVHVVVQRTGGRATHMTHGGDGRYEYPTFQIKVVGPSPAARDRAVQIWRALDGIHNTTLTAP